MDKLFTALLILHIAGGFIGLVSGTINLIMKKGGKRHRKVGKIFAAGMVTAGSSAFGLSVIHPNYFLFMMGVFTLYMVGTGTRYIYMKLSGKETGPKVMDWILTITMAVIGSLLFGFGIWLLVNSNNFGIVFITFGTLSLVFVRSDLKNYRGRSRFKNYWLLAHISRMTGGYIASLTAFLVVNAQYSPVEIPPVLVWLLPSAILAPLIVKWSKKMAVKKLME